LLPLFWSQIVGSLSAGGERATMAEDELYHLVQEDVWQAARESGVPYFPPTYLQVRHPMHPMHLHLHGMSCSTPPTDYPSPVDGGYA
jgi:hypothetical protein